MGLNFPSIGGGGTAEETVYYTGSGEPVAGDLNKTIGILNGPNTVIWTFQSGVFSPDDWQTYRKAGSGEAELRRGTGVTFLSVWGNVDLKIDGGYGNFVHIQMVEESVSSVVPEVNASANYIWSPGFPFTPVVGQKILVSGFTNAANNGIKTVNGIINVSEISVAETLVLEGPGGVRTMTPQDTFLVSGSIKT
jgi:hypothetical protein